MTICHEQLPPRTPININCLYICGRGTIAAETHGEQLYQYKTHGEQLYQYKVKVSLYQYKVKVKITLLSLIQ